MSNTIDNNKPKFISIEYTEGAVYNDGRTYNQAGTTYNQAGQLYGGFYGSTGPKPKNIKVVNK